MQRTRKVNARPPIGQTWLELDTLYQACLSQVAAVCEIAPVLANPLFSQQSPYYKELVSLGKELNTKSADLVDKINVIREQYLPMQKEWERQQELRKVAYKNKDKETGRLISERMDAIEFQTITFGESFYAWQNEWTTAVIPVYLQLSDAMVKTRDYFGEKA